MQSIRRTLRDSADNSWVLIVAPRRSIVTEILAELRPVCKVMGFTLDLITSEKTFTPSNERAIRLITASNLLSLMSRGTQHKALFSGLRMVLCENLELLDPAYELGISTLMHETQQFPVRYVGLSNSLNDPADLAAWLNVDPSALHSFRPNERDQALTVSTTTFTIPQSAALFKAMAKPAHAAIQSVIRGVYGELAIVFVPSRSQCRSVALDLITQCALEVETGNGYRLDEIAPDALERSLARLQDRSLVDFITGGVGFFHEGISKSDRTVMLELYAEGIVRVFIVPHDSCWSLPVRAAVVVVMGTQYFHVNGNEWQLRDYSLEELVRMQGRAVRHNNTGHFHLFCQAEGKDTFIRFLNDGLPLESKLLESDELRTWYQGQRNRGSIRSKQDGVDALSFTFLARRLETNPGYYDMTTESRSKRLSRIVDSLEGAS